MTTTIDWVHRLPKMEEHEEIMARVTDQPLADVQAVTDRLIVERGRPLTREEFGYPRHMDCAEILTHVELAVFDLLDRIDARPLDRARFDVLFGY